MSLQPNRKRNGGGNRNSDDDHQRLHRTEGGQRPKWEDRVELDSAGLSVAAASEARATAGASDNGEHGGRGRTAGLDSQPQAKCP
eukprot:11746499-Alexandrium_andersonii.AAC.1